MTTKLVQIILPLFLAVALSGQAEFPYSVTLEPYSIPGLAGIHSYAHGQHDGKWVIIGGRLDGIHARQPFSAFPASQNNTTIRVVDPESGSAWTASLNALPTGLQEQLQSTNMQFFQDGDLLVIVGGYAFSSSANDHITFPNLTTVNVPGLIEDIINGEPIAGNFQQITDDVFAVTGGYLGKIGDEFYLVGGQRFDGRYNPMNHPTFVQTYTDAIRKFTLENIGGNWVFNNYSVISDPLNLHRRDYNLLPQIYPGGEFGYTIFSGVFQLNEDLPFLYPVDITAAGHVPVDSFNQYLCNYHTAHAALFDEGANAMHNLFFGGISQYYYNGATLVQDDNVPFVKTISRVSRVADGSLLEARLPVEMPSYLGAGAELIFNDELPQAAPGIVRLSAISTDSFLLGYIVGGIESPSQNPFAFNDTGMTSAATTIYKVYLSKSGATPTGEAIMPGYHDFTVSVSPNPNNSSVFRIKANAPEAGNVEIFMVDTTGKLLLNLGLEGLQQGKNTLEVEMKNPVKGMAFLKVLLNGKYAASTKIIFE
ncbi:MAG: T9SS C-terminal target domain-containing protein [Saprospiraceae bacterium]|nr:T9SS C-terminal target domain-containing protein [Saprospiraceae bacterium]MCF8251916.1 T9SS C-terminal target domain-containing protein [Saprospiraceae bacterium]MCF8281591.1 hypothetical protein [Bacteroidales bacterium]MCF8313568.1 T9SS C-terminal target domain-containing protein [Saprospiraceae bacterium]MCF8442300.1 T9SS C-terminal target domain-containing protein [Saprospiraceae bacterium]